jgi:hypothetical protein
MSYSDKEASVGEESVITHAIDVCLKKSDNFVTGIRGVQYIVGKVNWIDIFANFDKFQWDDLGLINEI